MKRLQRRLRSRVIFRQWTVENQNQTSHLPIRLLSDRNKTLDYFRDSGLKMQESLFIQRNLYSLEFFFDTELNDELPWTRIGLATKIRISVFRFLDAEKIFKKVCRFLEEFSKFKDL